MLLESIVKKQNAMVAAREAMKQRDVGGGHKTIGLLISANVRDRIIAVQKEQNLATYKEAVHLCIEAGLQAMRG